MKRYVTIQRSHGYFGGAIHEDLCPTIDRSIDYQHIVIGEIMENEIFDKALNTVPKDSNIRIRKLTPKECYRLMGFDDESFSRAEQVNSNSQLYKQAGNSIVVNVLEAIFKQML